MESEIKNSADERAESPRPAPSVEVYLDALRARDAQLPPWKRFVLRLMGIRIARGVWGATATDPYGEFVSLERLTIPSEDTKEHPSVTQEEGE